MFDRDDLAESYADIPRLPLLGLIDLVLPALERNDNAELTSFREALASDGSRPEALAPGDLIGAIAPLIDAAYPVRSIEWHLHRQLHRADLALEPPPSDDAVSCLRRHRAAIERMAGLAPDELLYSGLSLRSPKPEVLQHLARFAATDIGAAAVLGRSGLVHPGDVPLDAIRGSYNCVLRALIAAGVAQPDEAHVLSIAEGAAPPLDAIRWLRRVNDDRDDTFALIDVDHLPIRVDAVFRVPPHHSTNPDERNLWSTIRAARGTALPATELVPGELVSVTMFDVRGVHAPAAGWENPDMLVNIVKRYPQLAGVFAHRFRNAQHPPADESIRALAVASAELLGVFAAKGWLAALEGASDVVPVALQLRDVELRTRTLIALGAPATAALEELVTADLAILASDDAAAESDAYRRLCEVAGRAASLGLPFWEKRLDSPRAFLMFWSVGRLRAAFTLRPSAVHRAVERAVKRQEEREIGLDVLAAVANPMDAFPLAPVADAVVALVRDGEQSLNWRTRFHLLAKAGSPEALDLLLEVVRGLPPVDVSVQATMSAAAWETLVAAGNIDLGALIDELVRAEPDLGPTCELCLPAAAAILDALCQVGLGLPPSDSERKSSHALRGRAGLFAWLLHQHRLELSDELFDRTLAEVANFVSPRVITDHRRARREPPRHGSELPWDALLEPDLGHVTVEIGAWFADRLRDPRWRHLNAPKELGRAVKAHHRRVLGAAAEPVFAALGDRWPTRSAMQDAATSAGLNLSEKLLDRCADEALPQVLRAALDTLPVNVEATNDPVMAHEHWFSRWVFETAWVDAPELLARQLAEALRSATQPAWRRGIAVALVALREPCGTTVPDALTFAMHEAGTDDDRVFYQRQRDTFARARVSQEQSVVAPQQRSREAYLRLVRHARLSRGLR